MTDAVERLHELGVRGILIKAAERGYITDVKCAMPECLCPKEMGGSRFFEAVPAELPDWMPTADHIELKSEGGKLTVDNVRLAHRLCNRVDYAKTHGKPHAADQARVAAAREKAISYRSFGTPRDVRWPGRRDRIIGYLTDLWERSPGMRLGQLIETLLTTDAAVLFAMEDDEIEQRLEAATRSTS